MATIEAIRRIVVEAQAKGLDQVATQLTKVADAQKGVVATSTQVTTATRSTEQAFAREQRQLDSTLVAYEKYARSVKTVVAAREQGLTTEQRSADLINLAEARLRKATGTTAEFTQSTGLARHELINLGRQAQDVGVSLVSGQSPLMVLAQQGAQIADVFASSRTTVRDALAQIAGMALRIAPVAVAIAAVTTALLAMNRAADQSREARIATTSGRGQLSDVTAGQVGGLAEQARAPGMSLNESREGVLEFVRAGASAQTLLQGMGLSLRLAATRGIELGAAFKELASAAQDPAGAIVKLNEIFPIFTKSEMDAARTLQTAGDRAGAAKIIFDKLPQTLVQNKDATTLWQREVAAFNTTLSQMIDLAADAASKVPKLLKQATEPRLLPPTNFQADRLGARPGGGLRAVVRPDIAPMRSEATQEAVKQAAALKENVDKIREAELKVNAELERQAKLRADNKRDIDRINESLADEIRVMGAITTEQKAAAEATRVRNELMRQTGPDKPTQQVIDATAIAAATRVQAAATAEAKQALFVQQQQIDMYGRLATAAGMQGLAGIKLNAELQEEMKLRQAGLNVMEADNQARIKNAGIIAEQATKLRDIAQAQEIRASGRDQVQLIQLETSLIGANDIERQRRLSIMQGEIQARALERQGLEESAAATRNSTAAIANQTAAMERRKAAYEAAQQAEYEGRVRYAQEGFYNTTVPGPKGQSTQVTGKNLSDLNLQFGLPARSMELSVTDPKKIEADRQKVADIQRAALDRSISLAQRALQKQIAEIQKTDEAIADRASAANERLTALEAEQQKREQAAQTAAQRFLAAGPSPFEQNPDLYYDPKKRLLFAEQIAGNTGDLLDAQIKAAKAEVAAAEAAQKGVEDAKQAAQDQIDALEAQRQQLDDAADLLAAGVDLSKQELDSLKTLIEAVRNELPANLATAFDRMRGASEATVTKSLMEVPKAAGGTAPIDLQMQRGLIINYGGALAGGINRNVGGFQEGGSVRGPGNGTSDSIPAWLSDGEFIVKADAAAKHRALLEHLNSGKPIMRLADGGSVGSDVSKFVLGLAGRQGVATIPVPIQPPVIPAGKGIPATTIERMIVQLPVGSDPMVVVNKASRGSLKRATRRLGRMV